jgi:hypothetical protein
MFLLSLVVTATWNNYGLDGRYPDEARLVSLWSVFLYQYSVIISPPEPFAFHLFRFCFLQVQLTRRVLSWFHRVCEIPLSVPLKWGWIQNLLYFQSRSLRCFSWVSGTPSASLRVFSHPSDQSAPNSRSSVPYVFSVCFSHKICSNSCLTSECHPCLKS